MLITNVRAHNVRIPYDAGPASFKQGAWAIAAGENACTVHQFRQMMNAGAVSYAQPSVIKVGGITEHLKIVALADEMGIKLAPHSPYFGSGFLATLRLMSLRDDGSFIEVFYMNRAACLWRGRIDVDANGTIAVPDGPGLGYEPDEEVMDRYRVPWPGSGERAMRTRASGLRSRGRTLIRWSTRR